MQGISSTSYTPPSPKASVFLSGLNLVGLEKGGEGKWSNLFS